MQNIIWGYHVGLSDSKIYCNDFMPQEKGENGKAITRLGVPSIAGRLLKVIETCVYDLSLQTHTPLHYILGLSSQTLTPAKR